MAGWSLGRERKGEESHAVMRGRSKQILIPRLDQGVRRKVGTGFEVVRYTTEYEGWQS